VHQVGYLQRLQRSVARLKYNANSNQIMWV